MVGVALAVAVTSTWVLYRAAFKEERARLIEIAQSQARMIEAITRFNIKHGLTGHAGGAGEAGEAVTATLRQITDAHERYKGFGETGEFTLARREGGNIVFLLSHRHLDLDTPRPVPLDSTLAEPMRRALKGLSGTVVGLDYRGRMVLAAHEPVAELNAGIVAKIDLAEIRAPFIKAGLTSAGGVILIVLLGVVVFRRVSAPIIQRERAERDAAEKSALLEKTLEYMGHGFCVFDGDCKLAAFNRKYVELYDFPPGFIHVGLDHEKLIRHLVERGLLKDADGGSIEERVRRRVDSAKLGEERSNELPLPDGTYYLYSRMPLPDGGFVTTYTDITEHKRIKRELQASEERLRRTFESSGVGMTIRNHSDRTLVANDASQKMLGYSQEELQDLHFDDITHPDDREENKISRRKLLDGDVDSIQVTKRYIRKDGKPVWLINDMSTVRDADGKLLYMLNLFQDITDRKRIETELLEARNKAEFSNKAKSEFLANMSHELRTPLNSIIGFSEIMSKDHSQSINIEKYREFSTDILDSGRYLLDLINDILDLSKIDAGKFEIREELVDVAKSIERSWRITGGRPGAQQAEFVQTMSPEGLTIRADSRRMQQILINLFSNALKFTPHGGKIAVSATITEAGFRLTVSDSGVGIAENDIEKVLSPFGQVDNSYQRHSGGIGLGLPLTKKLTELHDGTLSIFSEAGQGTTVEILLPKERIVSSGRRENEGLEMGAGQN